MTSKKQCCENSLGKTIPDPLAVIFEDAESFASNSPLHALIFLKAIYWEMLQKIQMVKVFP